MAARPCKFNSCFGHIGRFNTFGNRRSATVFVFQGKGVRPFFPILYIFNLFCRMNGNGDILPEVMQELEQEKLCLDLH